MHGDEIDVTPMLHDVTPILHDVTPLLHDVTPMLHCYFYLLNLMTQKKGYVVPKRYTKHLVRMINLDI